MTVLPVFPLVVGDDEFDVQVRALSAKLATQDRRLAYLDRYYEGTQPLQFLAPEVQAQVGDRLASMVVNWPRVIVDSVQRRCTVQGFRLGNGGETDDDLWDIWTASDMPMWSRQNHIDALVHARAFVSVGPGDDGLPLIAVESAHQVAVDYSSQRAGLPTSALKRWQDADGQWALLLLPDQARLYRAEVSSLVTPRWSLADVQSNPLGVVPLVPIINRPRVLNQDGESELADVIPLADAVNKLATDMLVMSEMMAMPRRYATGIAIPGGPDRERLQAEVSAYWDNATKGKTWLAGEGVQFGQFDAASLSNFTDAIQMLTAQIAAIAGLPPHFLGINTANPASADAIRSAEASLIERSREKHETWGAAYKRVMQLALAVADGLPFAQVARVTSRMETVWKDPETRTKAQDADAAVKLHAEGIYDDVQAQESVGMTPAQINAQQIRRQQALDTAATADVTARLALARRLEVEDGLTKNAALAAVGLLAAAGLNSAETPTQ